MSRLRFIVDYAWKSTVLAVLLSICIWPALYNGQPLFFTDTTAYIRGADAGIARITGRQSVWSPPPLSATGELKGPGHLKSTNNLKEKSVIAGRSVYYGALLYVGDVMDHLWPSIVLQAAAVVLALSLTLSNTSGFDWFTLSVGVVGLAVATPMAFYASFLMPDVFAGLAILAAANLVAYGDTMTRSRLTIWVMLLCLAVLFHTSHLLLVLVISAVAVFWAILGRASLSWRGIACLAFSVVVGVAGEAAFTFGVTRMLGAAPVRPPAVMTRIIVDGPGAAYLKANCPQVEFTMCRFVDRLPPAQTSMSPGSDARRQDAEISMFMLYNVADADTRRALGAEQFSFALATIKYDPVGVIVAAARNSIIQFRSIRLEFNYLDSFFADRVPQPYLAIMEKSKAWAGKMQTDVFSDIVVVVTILGALCTAGYFFRSRCRTEDEFAFGRFVEIIVLGVALNAVICGVLSGPYDRYQARVIWLVPFAATLALYRRRHPLW
jgi:hypothetical protein